MKNNFDIYNLEQGIIEALNILKYNQPTLIQQKVIPYAMKGCDLSAKSQTGSGKTAAFGIPICNKVRWEENIPQALVLEPTRELTVQVKEELFCIGRNKKLKVQDVFGGFPIEKQILTLKQKSHIVVGTPGRLLDHISRGSIDLSGVRTLVIDEADLMFDMGFLGDVETILSHISDCQIMLFSATLDNGLQDLMDRHMKAPVVISIESSVRTVKDIEQGIIIVEDIERKYKAFLDTLICENPDSCIIFCGTKEMVNVLCRKLGRDGVRCGMIHGDIEQQDRIRTIDGFRLGKFRYLIATDVAARGIDFPNLSLVVNYDFPTGKEAYVHRIGRTGRNGEKGKAISFLTDADEKMRKTVEEYINYEIPVIDFYEAVPEERSAFFTRQKEKNRLKERKGSDFNKTITRLTIGGGKKAKIRTGDVVATICGIDGITVDDIGVIDIRDSLIYVDIMNGKGSFVCEELPKKTLKGKHRKVKVTKNRM